MTWTRRHYILLAGIWLLALVLRTAVSDNRPFHVDEAVNGVIAGRLLTEGAYQYDPGAYHGPVLYYLTTPLAKLAGVREYADLNEGLLRLLPALAGSLLVLIVLVLRRFIPPGAGLTASFLMAVSPMLVYYSRYYIHEMLVVLFASGLFVFGYRYIRIRRISDCIISGLLAGLLICTKETWIIIVFGLGLSFYITFPAEFRPRNFKQKHALSFTGAVILPVVLFYTSFFSNPHGLYGLKDFIGSYLMRAGGEEIHRHPVYYYFQTMFFDTGGNAIFLPETGILIILIAGLWRHRGEKLPDLTRLSGLIAVILFLIFSLIPYKTPWNTACVIPPLILSAALLISGTSRKKYRMVVTAGSALLCLNMVILTFILPYRSSNPYAYAQSGADVIQVGAEFDKIQQEFDMPDTLKIAVIAKNHAYWPLPWYFRHWKNTGWWDHIPDNFYRMDILVVSDSLEPELSRLLYEDVPVADRDMYVYLFDRTMALYPGNDIIGLIKYRLWERIGKNNSE
jgi:uncharacterized protein (TIGR03663 family)